VSFGAAILCGLLVTDTPQTLRLDIAANKAAKKYTRREQMKRVLWAFGGIGFAWIPRPFSGLRRAVLTLFGAKIGPNANVHSSAILYMPWNVEVGEWAAVGENAFIYSLGKVRIGRNATVSYRAHVCAGTHDFNDPTLPLLKPSVTIEDNAWIGTEAFIGPGVTIGNGAIVGARAVVVKDVPPMHIVAGNPARTVGMRKPAR
jgi:putative colanic acid biosynthesis acetyltransferase WcaF